MSEVERYMPLETDAVYEYGTHSAAKAVGMMTIQIRRTGPDTLELRIGGRREHVRTDHTGIRFAEGTYLLKAPPSVGNTWTGRLGIVRVTDVDEDVTVPAGHFRGCLRTEERGSGMHAATTVTSIYCPRVGLASLDDVRGNGLRETALLRQFGPRIDPLVGVPAAVE